MHLPYQKFLPALVLATVTPALALPFSAPVIAVRREYNVHPIARRAIYSVVDVDGGDLALNSPQTESTDMSSLVVTTTTATTSTTEDAATSMKTSSPAAITKTLVQTEKITIPPTTATVTVQQTVEVTPSAIAQTEGEVVASGSGSESAGYPIVDVTDTTTVAAASMVAPPLTSTTTTTSIELPMSTLPTTTPAVYAINSNNNDNNNEAASSPILSSPTTATTTYTTTTTYTPTFTSTSSSTTTHSFDDGQWHTWYPAWTDSEAAASATTTAW